MCKPTSSGEDGSSSMTAMKEKKKTIKGKWKVIGKVRRKDKMSELRENQKEKKKWVGRLVKKKKREKWWGLGFEMEGEDLMKKKGQDLVFLNGYE